MTANEKYNEMQRQVLNQLQLLQEKLQDHQDKFFEDQNNWGRVGDLNYIATQLENINSFLK